MNGDGNNMLSKRSTAAFWNADLLTAHILGVTHRGADKSMLDKLGSAGTPFGSDIRPEKGYAFVHVITNGAGEVYGQNSNLDFFNESAGNWTFPNPRKGMQKTAQLKGGLKEYHKTYREHGGVYRNHKNSHKTDPSTGMPFEKLGSIADEQYNEDMHRGELIVKLATDKWSDVLHKIASEAPVCWSMGAAVPREICSMCGNEARKLSDRCPCIRGSFNKIAEDGHVAFAINDETYYHDISEVGTNPAMKIAYTLEKVAASGMTPHKPEFQAQGLWLPVDLMNKVAPKQESKRYTLLHKLAKKEKEVAPERADIAEGLSHSLDEEKDIADHCKGIPLDNLFGDLTKNKMLLPPRAFSVIVIRSCKPETADSEALQCASGVPDKLKSIFSDLLSSPSDTEDVVSDGHYQCPMCGGSSLSSKMSPLKHLLSTEPEALKKRVVIRVIKGDPEEKIEKVAMDSREDRWAQALAKEYAKYQLSFLASTGSADLEETVLAQNWAR